MTDTDVSHLVREPSFIEASVWRSPHTLNPLLEVLASPVVEETDDCYAPVIDFLSAHCTRETDWGRFTNPNYFFGESIRTEYQVFTVCPGESVEHNCVHARSERVGQGGEVIGG